ncbi:MAG: hypothetical protein LBD76_07580, partial [Prevotellaceae bacterium]|nr:hypothetical protein [Prevotellaceae bacterium]
GSIMHNSSRAMCRANWSGRLRHKSFCCDKVLPCPDYPGQGFTCACIRGEFNIMEISRVAFSNSVSMIKREHGLS